MIKPVLRFLAEPESSLLRPEIAPFKPFSWNDRRETVTTGLSEGTTPKASKEPTVIPAQIHNEKQIRLEEMTLDEDTNLQVKMTDEDGVVGVRRIAIKVLVDTPPQVKAEPSPF